MLLLRIRLTSGGTLIVTITVVITIAGIVVRVPVALAAAEHFGFVALSTSRFH